jgi:hypothetical protein
MHMLLITAAGLILLGLFLGIGHLTGKAVGQVSAARTFLPVWFLLALLNVTIGVVWAGYTVTQEAPVFVITFGIPAALAWWLQKRASRAMEK